MPCWYCGVRLTRGTATKEHVIPLSRGGITHYANLVTACTFCNHRLGDSPIQVKIEYRRRLRCGEVVNDLLDIWKSLRGVAEIPARSVACDTSAFTSVHQVTPELSDLKRFHYAIGPGAIELNGKYAKTLEKAQRLAASIGETKILLLAYSEPKTEAT